MGKNYEVEINRSTKTKLKNEVDKLRIHIKKIFSLSINGNLTPINRCMSRENICTLIIHHIS